jgi:tubulin monoglycylase TTLL3/8
MLDASTQRSQSQPSSSGKKGKTKKPTSAKKKGRKGLKESSHSGNSNSNGNSEVDGSDPDVDPVRKMHFLDLDSLVTEQVDFRGRAEGSENDMYENVNVSYARPHIPPLAVGQKNSRNTSSAGSRGRSPYESDRLSGVYSTHSDPLVDDVYVSHFAGPNARRQSGSGPKKPSPYDTAVLPRKKKKSKPKYEMKVTSYIYDRKGRSREESSGVMGGVAPQSMRRTVSEPAPIRALEPEKDKNKDKDKNKERDATISGANDPNEPKEPKKKRHDRERAISESKRKQESSAQSALQRAKALEQVHSRNMEYLRKLEEKKKASEQENEMKERREKERRRRLHEEYLRKQEERLAEKERKEREMMEDDGGHSSSDEEEELDEEAQSMEERAKQAEEQARMKEVRRNLRRRQRELLASLQRATEEKQRMDQEVKEREALIKERHKKKLESVPSKFLAPTVASQLHAEGVEEERERLQKERESHNDSSSGNNGGNVSPRLQQEIANRHKAYLESLAQERKKKEIEDEMKQVKEEERKNKLKAKILKKLQTRKQYDDLPKLCDIDESDEGSESEDGKSAEAGRSRQEKRMKKNRSSSTGRLWRGSGDDSALSSKEDSDGGALTDADAVIRKLRRRSKARSKEKEKEELAEYLAKKSKEKSDPSAVLREFVEKMKNKREGPKLSVYETDMAVFKKKRHIPEDGKVYTIRGPYSAFKKAFKKRGWHYNKDPESPLFDFCFALKASDLDYKNLKKHQIVNHFEKNTELTTKVGLSRNLRSLVWFEPIDIDSFFPRCYDLGNEGEIDDFIGDFRQTAAISVLRYYVETNGAVLNAKIAKWSLTVLENVLTRLRNDEDGDICDSSVSSGLSETQWEILLAYAHRYVRRGVAEPSELSSHAKKQRPLDQKLVEDYEAAESETLEIRSKEQIAEALALLKKLNRQYTINGVKNLWIMKPAGKSRGRGIQVYDRLSEILELVKHGEERQWVGQKYIENPLLVHGRKSDIRQWVIVSDFNPLTIWIYGECYIRFASQKYSVDDTSNRFVHLCNNSVQKHADVEDDSYIEGNMWTAQAMQDHLQEAFPDLGSDPWESYVIPQVKKVVQYALMCAQDSVENRKNSFEFFGFDVMMDADLNVWLIEINSSPTMEHSTPITKRLCTAVIDDIVKVIIDLPQERKKKDFPGIKNFDTGDFHLIYTSKLGNVPHPISAYGSNLAIEGKKIG